jgi:hypothetical protein
MTNFTRNTTGKKGTRVSKSEHTAKAPSHRTGFFATLSNLLRGGGSGAPSSRRVRLAVTSLLAAFAALLALAITASAALAAETHVFTGSFGSEGSGAGQLERAEHSGIAVDQTSHDIYVADTSNNRVEQRQKAPVQNPGPEQEDLQFSSKTRSGCSPRW